MTKFEVTKAMQQAAERAYDAKASSQFQDYCYSGPMRAAITAAFEASGLVEENARLREAVEKARLTFNRYGDLHAAKPDEAKAARNYELADEMDRALNGETK